jgi:shikimate kinase
MTNDRPILIVGFMGCGKSTVARKLASRLGTTAVDLDEFITMREKRTPAEIINSDGETAFRAIETQTFRELLNANDRQVIALGGGAWTIEANRRLAAQHNCLSIWLDVPFDVCWSRITSGKGSVRPLAPDREAAARLYEARRPIYETAGLKIEAQSSDSISDRIISDLGLAAP